MSIYNMPLFSIPRKVRLKLEKIQRDFLCGGGTLEKKLLLIGWSIVCMDRGKEGQGIENLSSLNWALLGKWSWRFAYEKEGFWKQVIDRKYEKEERGQQLCKVRDGYGVGVWKDIRKGQDLFNSRVAFEVGNKMVVKFWKDTCCGKESLCVSFLSLYALASFKDVQVTNL